MTPRYSGFTPSFFAVVKDEGTSYEGKTGQRFYKKYHTLTPAIRAVRQLSANQQNKTVYFSPSFVNTQEILSEVTD